MNKKTNHNQIVNVFGFFLILIPILLISGPFLSDLAVSILAIVSLFCIRKKKFFYNYFFIIFIFFWILIIISSSFSENKILSLKSSFFYIRFCLYVLFIWWILENDNKILKKIYFILLFSFGCLILDSIFQYFMNYNVLNMKLVTKDRISSFFGDELKMGGYLMRLFPFLIALSIFFYNKKKHKNHIVPFILLLFLVQVTIFLSGERTSYFIFNFSLILFLLFLNDFKKIRIFILIVYFIITASFFTFDSPFKDRIFKLSIDQTQVYQKDKGIYIFSKQYHEHYLSAWKIFKDNFLIGIGPKNFREKCKEKKYNFSELTCSTHPHNFPLQLLAETGIFTFLIYLILNFFIWYNLIKNLIYKFILKEKYLDDFKVALLINIAILVWPLSPNGSIFNNWLSIILYYPVGFLLWSMRNNRKMYLRLKKRTF
jgi:O-antigen ligase